MALLLRDKPQEQAPSRTPARSSVAEVFESNFMNLKQMFSNSIKPLCFASIGLPPLHPTTQTDHRCRRLAQAERGAVLGIVDCRVARPLDAGDPGRT